MPPPAPFKIFVLLAGIAGISVTRFAVAISIGRGIRYFGEGLLAVWYGDRAMDFIRDNSRAVALTLVGLLILGLVGYALLKKARGPKRL